MGFQTQTSEDSLFNHTIYLPKPNTYRLAFIAG